MNKKTLLLFMVALSITNGLLEATKDSKKSSGAKSLFQKIGFFKKSFSHNDLNKKTSEIKKPAYNNELILFDINWHTQTSILSKSGMAEEEIRRLLVQIQHEKSLDGVYEIFSEKIMAYQQLKNTFEKENTDESKNDAKEVHSILNRMEELLATIAHACSDGSSDYSFEESEDEDC